MSVRPAKTQISLGIRPVCSESSLSAWRELESLATTERTAKTLIRLSGCPGWFESSLVAHSFCWFCHVAANMMCEKASQNAINSITEYYLDIQVRSKVYKRYTSRTVWDHVVSLYSLSLICIVEIAMSLRQTIQSKCVFIRLLTMSWILTSQ